MNKVRMRMYEKKNLSLKSKKVIGLYRDNFEREILT